MRDTIDLWHKVWPDPGAFVRASAQDLERFAELVRADQCKIDAKVADGFIGGDVIAERIRARSGDQTRRPL